MEGVIDKSSHSETCTYLPAKTLKKEPQEHTTELDKGLGEYMWCDKKTAQRRRGKGHLKQKWPVKDGLGDRLEMNHRGRYEITEDDSQE